MVFKVNKITLFGVRDKFQFVSKIDKIMKIKEKLNQVWSKLDQVLARTPGGCEQSVNNAKCVTICIKIRIEREIIKKKFQMIFLFFTIFKIILNGYRISS